LTNVDLEEFEKFEKAFEKDEVMDFLDQNIGYNLQVFISY
jgi:hypothetical protein